ncbi:hypothetical protein L484_016331 [Morus notabilis]|uniref:Uncharacterized protein n=1 Tax=Morus notabilis TaxID=981085 RepID=W9QNU4_9ROSA|nr:hypothetical protein L484_016331 [Morus notabilis]
MSNGLNHHAYITVILSCAIYKFIDIWGPFLRHPCALKRTFDSFCLQIGSKLFYGSGHGTNSNLVLWTKRLGTWKHHGQLNTCGVHDVDDGESCGAQNSQATRESLREWGPAHDIWEHRPGFVGNSSALMETAQ